MTASRGIEADSARPQSGLRAKLRVLVADDDPSMRSALSELVATESAFELVGLAADATEAVALAAELQPDVVLVDVRMPGGGGVTAARGIRRRAPNAKLIALSGQDDRATVTQMLEAGVIGYLLKGGAVEEIVDAIKRAPEGQGFLSMGVTRGVIAELAERLQHASLTCRGHKAIERRTLRALRSQNCLGIVYQPIVSLRDRTLVGAEALARFAASIERPPSLWFADASIVGLRTELELLSVRRAVEESHGLPDEAFLTVNVSPATLMEPALVEIVGGGMSSPLVLEITEHAPIDDYPRICRTLDKLRALGVRLAIDDAGAGYSSLRHILELAPDLIKLDMSLIRGIDHDRSKQALAAGLISFADKAGASIIAEGIECATEASMLVDLGVTYGQGYLFGRPQRLPFQASKRKLGTGVAARPRRPGRARAQPSFARPAPAR